MDTAQLELKCCGIDDQDDWMMSRWYDRRQQKLKTGSVLWVDFIPNNQSNTKRRHVPMTCCKQLGLQEGVNDPDDFLIMINMPAERTRMFQVMDGAYINLEYNCTVYERGCYSVIHEIYSDYSFEMQIYCIILICVSFALLLLSQLFATDVMKLTRD